MNHSVSEAVQELTEGSGYLLLEDYFPSELINEAHDLLYKLAGDEPDRASHFHGDESETTQKRVWNLPEKGEVFRQLASDPWLLEVMSPIIGNDLMLSSWAANITHPGAPAQEAHVDYPYWDLHKTANWPRTLNASFHLAVEIVVMIDEFTVENGATAFVPGSHKRCRWPETAAFASESIQAVAPAGSVLVFPALLWHAAQANNSRSSRAALLGSYTNKNIKPIEDWPRCISQTTLDRCSERMKSLLGVGYAYPAVMDELPGRSSQGTRSKKDISETQS